MQHTYTARNALLPRLGFPTYADYLNSELWAEIRDAILDRDGRRCRLCNKQAHIVHHIDYAEQTMRGETLDALVSLCHSCHYDVEFTKDEKKRSLPQARLTYFKLCKSGIPKQDGYVRVVCTSCNNTAPKNSKLCGACKRKLKNKSKLKVCSQCNKNWAKAKSTMCRTCKKVAK